MVSSCKALWGCNEQWRFRESKGDEELCVNSGPMHTKGIFSFCLNYALPTITRILRDEESGSESRAVGKKW